MVTSVSVGVESPRIGEEWAGEVGDPMASEATETGLVGPVIFVSCANYPARHPVAR